MLGQGFAWQLDAFQESHGPDARQQRHGTGNGRHQGPSRPTRPGACRLPCGTRGIRLPPLLTTLLCPWLFLGRLGRNGPLWGHRRDRRGRGLRYGRCRLGCRGSRGRYRNRGAGRRTGWHRPLGLLEIGVAILEAHLPVFAYGASGFGASKTWGRHLTRRRRPLQGFPIEIRVLRVRKPRDIDTVPFLVFIGALGAQSLPRVCAHTLTSPGIYSVLYPMP